MYHTGAGGQYTEFYGTGQWSYGFTPNSTMPTGGGGSTSTWGSVPVQGGAPVSFYPPWWYYFRPGFNDRGVCFEQRRPVDFLCICTSHRG